MDGWMDGEERKCEKRRKWEIASCVGGGWWEITERRGKQGESFSVCVVHREVLKVQMKKKRSAACVRCVARCTNYPRGLWASGVLMSTNENTPRLRGTKALSFNDKQRSWTEGRLKPGSGKNFGVDDNRQSWSRNLESMFTAGH